MGTIYTIVQTTQSKCVRVAETRPPASRFVATKKTLFFESNNSQKGGGGGGGGFRVETRREKNLRWEIDDDVV